MLLMLIGQTGRNLKSRIYEHFRSLITMKSVSLFANHLLDNNHKFNPEEIFKIVHVIEKSYELNSHETLEINKAIKLNKT